MAKITQGLPGQFQVAYPRRPTRFGLLALQTATSTFLRLLALTQTPLKIEAVAELPIIKGDSGYSYEGAYGITVDDEEGTGG